MSLIPLLSHSKACPEMKRYVRSDAIILSILCVFAETGKVAVGNTTYSVFDTSTKEISLIFHIIVKQYAFAFSNCSYR